MSVFGAGSQIDPRSPGIQSVHAGEGVGDDDISEISILPVKSPADADNGMVIPPWPDDLKSTISTLARILIGGQQIVCTRAEFGLQADPEWANMVVRGRVVRCEPWQAQHDIANALEIKGCIALIGRGGCQFTEKARRAQEAGAIAVVIVNHSDVLFNVLGKMPSMKLPIVSITKRDADTLSDGTMVAVQWGEGLAPVVSSTVADSKAWSFKMSSHVGFASADAHLPVVV